MPDLQSLLGPRSVTRTYEPDSWRCENLTLGWLLTLLAEVFVAILSLRASFIEVQCFGCQDGIPRMGAIKLYD
ncbi:GSCOCG00002237001-RA-CDS [Cotesia congregata]|nr:GSCOCG00002237001-RA-CDS [Cotesia congregata]